MAFPPAFSIFSLALAVNSFAVISKLVSLGLPREEIAAAIAYGFMGGYVNKFVRKED